MLELTDEMAMEMAAPEPPPPPPSFRKVEPRDDLEFAERPAAPVLAGRLRRAAAAAATADHGPVDRLRGRDRPSIRWRNTVLSSNARTLEDLVKEMLRPMLKSWLDDNLPGMVERIVKAEIERVSRGR